MVCIASNTASTICAGVTVSGSSSRRVAIYDSADAISSTCAHNSPTASHSSPTVTCS